MGLFLALSLIIIFSAIVTSLLTHFIGAYTQLLAIRLSKKKLSQLSELLLNLFFILPMGIFRLLSIIWLWGFAISTCYTFSESWWANTYWVYFFYGFSWIAFLYVIVRIEIFKTIQMQNNRYQNPLPKDALMAIMAQSSRRDSLLAEQKLAAQIGAILFIIFALLLLFLGSVRYYFVFMW
ncbi:MAG: hypothetical protein EAZ55_10975 [Cytophagales bacterium]|nr:MAG: hypothetical protein EAZ55_10975 [Cytophagales bacterium]